MGYKHLVTHGNFYLALEKERNDKKRKLLTRNQHEIFKKAYIFPEKYKQLKGRLY